MPEIEGEVMQRSKKPAGFLALLLGTVLLTACPSQTNISKINANPDRFRGKEVGIAGTVTNSFGALGTGTYELDDGTGRLWVATRNGVPSRGARIGARGHIRTGFNFAGRNFGTVMEETERRTR
jgi:hypothetical protein